jgi:hypothetical protein
MTADGSPITVHGRPTPEEVAAVLAVVAARTTRRPGDDPYRRWRRIRLAALRAGDR